MEFKLIRMKIESGVAQIILNRPDVMNALNFEMVTEIGIAVKALAENESIRVLIISGGGADFAAGADIPPMLDSNPEQARKRTFNNTFNAVEKLEIPVIAAVSGYALGGGLELALACDIRICSAEAKLGLPEIKLGIFPGAGGTQRLPKIIGTGRAKEMILTGNPINARKAYEYGLCNIITDGSPVDEALKLSGKFTMLSRTALSGAKRSLNFSMSSTLEAGIRFEEDLWSGCFSTEDQYEGMKAFIEKRKPVFTGKQRSL
jgi:enoyl-CoA hydratase/carnithine racemase